MHVAASKGCDHTVECLVKKGANINMKDKAEVCVVIAPSAHYLLPLFLSFLFLPYLSPFDIT